jgi:hypothetical protein
MFILLQPTDFSIKNIYFLEKKMNMIMDGFFTKILFTNSFMTMNGIFVQLPIKKIPSLKSQYFLQFDQNCHKELINQMIIIEKQLLQYYSIFYNVQKRVVYNLKNQLMNGSIKYYKNFSNNPSAGGILYIKISGIWENHSEIGITFKIIE